MLIVGHTHEDVDAEFAIGSRYIYKETGTIKTPQGFWAALRRAYRRRVAVFEEVLSVLDWIWWFGDPTAARDSEAYQRACARPLAGLGTERSSGFKRSPHSFWIHVSLKPSPQTLASPHLRPLPALTSDPCQPSPQTLAIPLTFTTYEPDVRRARRDALQGVRDR